MPDQERLRQLAQEVIAKNIYLTLATSGDAPWATPLFYCTDAESQFYFISQTDSEHVRHIVKNPHVAFAIFDSHQAEGAGIGVQGSGYAQMLEAEADILEGLKVYQTSFIELSVEALLSPNGYRLFKLTPEHLYVVDPDAKVDRRVEVHL